MRKQVFGRKFKRDKNERKALFSGLVSAMVLHGKIKTTEEKAKAVKGDIEKIVTKAKKDEASARRLLKSILKDHEIDKMINEVAPRFKNRAGGYTRIIKTGRRFNDNASMVIMEWVEGEAVVVTPKESVKKEVKKEKKIEKVKTKLVKKAVKKTEKKTK
jgi:large subunit ribosomal protein L17